MKKPWRKTGCACILVAALCVPVPAPAGSGRFVERLRLAAGPALVVAEGEFEPRSTGSYTIRLYSGIMAEYPYDDFVCGLVRPRDGAVERLQEADVTGDRTAELVVVVRSAGTGGYLSADAWSVTGDGLTLAAHVEGLDKTADPVTALRGAGRPGSGVARCGR